MSESEIIKYIESPYLLGSVNIDSLRKLVKEFPYYETAHVLLLKALKVQGDDDFESQLSKSSIYISNRDILFKFLTTNFKAEISKIDIESQAPIKGNVLATKEGAKLLKNRDVKRRINHSFEGMGDNISETITSQLEFSVVKDEDKLEYSAEIYFLDEERNGNNNVVSIETNSEDIKALKKYKGKVQVEEERIFEKKEEESVVGKEEAFELIDLDVEKDDRKGDSENQKQASHFNLADYADEEAIAQENDLISMFIENKPRITPIELDVENVDVSEQSIQEDSELLSETLIKVYIKQGLFEKAIQSYQKLSLKYPEKNAYFASQINILEDKI